MVSAHLTTICSPFATKPETTNLSLLQQLSIVADYLAARLCQRVSISGTQCKYRQHNALSMGLFAVSLDAIGR